MNFSGKGKSGKPRLSRLFFVFLNIGAVTIGGGYAMVPVLEHELVKRHKLISHRKIEGLLTIAQSSPGPIAVNTALITGYHLRGVRGAAVGVLGTIIAPVSIMLIIAAFLETVMIYPRVQSMFALIRAVVVALIASAGIKAALRTKSWYVPCISAGLTVLLILTDFNPFFLVPAGALGGIVYEWIRVKKGGAP
ncbi:MAG: chromate transporter [Spirochaetia bacterium]